MLVFQRHLLGVDVCKKSVGFPTSPAGGLTFAKIMLVSQCHLWGGVLAKIVALHIGCCIFLHIFSICAIFLPCIFEGSSRIFCPPPALRHQESHRKHGFSEKLCVWGVWDVIFLRCTFLHFFALFCTFLHFFAPHFLTPQLALSPPPLGSVSCGGGIVRCSFVSNAASHLVPRASPGTFTGVSQHPDRG